MDLSSRTDDPVNIDDRDPPTSREPGSLFVPAGRRHAIPLRVVNGEAPPDEIIHHLLGSYASDTLTGALVELHILAELVAEHLADKRHIGTVANIVVSRLEVCIALAEQLDLDRNAA